LELLFMAYVITDNCIKDALCVDVCPTDCIHPKKDEPDFEAATQMFIDPAGCIDCGACVQPARRIRSIRRKIFRMTRSSSQKPTPLISLENVSLV
jgi:ferredoxin